MGNPHAVLLVDDTETAPVATLGPAVQASPRFAEGVNVGFMQVQSRSEVRLRVYERGVGETRLCGCRGGHSAGPAGRQCRGAYPWRSFDHRLGGGDKPRHRHVGPGFHDRPGHHRISGRN
jgi:hypothetical protein